jgi:hypothetical protein
MSPGAGGSRCRDDINSIQLATQDFSNLPPFEKNFYVEHPAVTARSPADVDTYRKLREIHVQGSGVPKPCTTFEEASFPGEGLGRCSSISKLLPDLHASGMLAATAWCYRWQGQSRC